MGGLCAFFVISVLLILFEGAFCEGFCEASVHLLWRFCESRFLACRCMHASSPTVAAVRKHSELQSTATNVSDNIVYQRAVAQEIALHGVEPAFHVVMQIIRIHPSLWNSPPATHDFHHVVVELFGRLCSTDSFIASLLEFLRVKGLLILKLLSPRTSTMSPSRRKC